MYCGYSHPEEFLNYLANSDEEGFLKNVTHWCSHRPMLLLALALTKGEVKEFGSGDGSTQYLRDYCKRWNREFYSYESDPIYADKNCSLWVEDWGQSRYIFDECELAFIDHAPGEDRWKAIQYLCNKAKLIVVHDSEEGGAGDYQLERIFPLFKYRLNYNKNSGGAGATLLSNEIDVTVFAGLKLGDFQFDNN